MELSPEGWMRPVVGAGANARANAEAAQFREMCPGRRMHAVKRTDEKSDPTFGVYISAWRGRASDSSTRQAGSSAGVLTAMSAFLVDSGRVDAVRGAAMDAGRPSRTVPVRITSREEALAASGSRYAPVSTLVGVNGDGSEAVVAKPCEVSALTALYGREDRPIALSFFCAGTPSQAATLRLVEKLGVDPERVTRLRYRGEGWPGAFEVSDGERSGAASYDDSWGKHLGRDLQWRCKICPDGTGEDADIAVGDYWKADDAGYPVFDDADGESVVIARTTRGHELLMEAAEAGIVVLAPVNLVDVERIQPLQRSRKLTVGVRLLARVLSFKAIPIYRGYGFARRAIANPRLSLKTLAGTLLRSWRDRLNGRRT